ncbi:MAG: transposase, partial [Lachnospiraceae bacterium]|nr:transposase [Lachnospiraceae bacterium]
MFPKFLFTGGKKMREQSIVHDNWIIVRKVLVIADRGYESYNNLAHIQEKGWHFLFRIKDGKNGIKQGLSLPEKDLYDIHIELNLTRKQTNEVKVGLLLYPLRREDRMHYRAGVRANLSAPLAETVAVPLQILLVVSRHML